MRKYYIAPGTIAEATPLDYVKVARDAGYDGVGLRLQNSPRYPIHPIVGNAALIREMKAVIADAGMDVLDILAFYVQPPAPIEDFKPALATAAEFGARYLLTQSDDPDWSRMCDNISRFFELADTYDRLTGKVTPHTLRHTAATWLMQRGVSEWFASGYLGMSPETLRSVYGHHHPEFLRGAANAIGTKGESVSVVVSVADAIGRREKTMKSL